MTPAPPAPVLRALLEACKLHDVPLTLAAGVAWVSSRYEQNTPSDAEGIGVMRLSAGDALALQCNVHDLAGNCAGGVRMLAELRACFPDWQRVLAAYRWGTDNVRRFPEPKFWPQQVAKFTLDVREAGRELAPALMFEALEVVTVSPSIKLAQKLGMH